MPKPLTLTECLSQLKTLLGPSLYDCISKWYVLVNQLDKKLYYNDKHEFSKKVLVIENQLKDVNMDILAKNREAIALIALFLRYMRVSKHGPLLQFLDTPELVQLPNSRMLYQIVQGSENVYDMVPGSLVKSEYEEKAEASLLPVASILPNRLRFFEVGSMEENNKLEEWSLFINYLQTGADLRQKRNFCSKLDGSPAKRSEKFIQRALENMSEKDRRSLSHKINIEKMKLLYGKASAAVKIAIRLNKYINSHKKDQPPSLSANR